MSKTHNLEVNIGRVTAKLCVTTGNANKWPITVALPRNKDGESTLHGMGEKKLWDHVTANRVLLAALIDATREGRRHYFTESATEAGALLASWLQQLLFNNEDVRPELESAAKDACAEADWSKFRRHTSKNSRNEYWEHFMEDLCNNADQYGIWFEPGEM